VLPVNEEPPHVLYPQADVFVLPSAGESFGMVAAEAAAAGTPVIVSDRCGIAAFFEGGEALVVPYDSGAIVDAVQRVLSDTGLREQLSRRGYGRTAELLGSRGRGRADLPRRRLAHGGDEALDRRLVAPPTNELARALTAASQSRILREPPGSCGRGDVTGRHDETVLSVAKEILAAPTL
jgi:hypothetical protein